MQILFADKFPAKQLQQLQASGYATIFQPDLQAADLPANIAGNDVLVVRSTKVDKETIQAANNLKLIIRAGAGTNTIDKAFAAEQGITVCNVPGKNSVAVAELTLGLLLSIDRNIPDNVRELRDGQWNKKRYSSAQGLMGRTIGIIGAGSIGMAVAERARAFGLSVLMINKPGRSQAILDRMKSLGISTVESIDILVAESDIVSVHVPATDSTRNLINAELLSKMRDGAILLNTSRGDVVDEQALLDAMDSKSIRAGLDVYPNEPGQAACEFDCQLAKHPNVYGTHHIGASTEQAQSAVADGVLEVVKAFENGTKLNCVN
ncbi:MAG: hydroxyacid dehydrogenase [Gammaproteobacteria bacterium]|nr:hydroxyacid dehydrogenase [Gammaproteobacteria bacterium]MYI89967.1 hydroxyacid dehydrogenase [Gammaproteobacteria bacterium]